MRARFSRFIVLVAVVGLLTGLASAPAMAQDPAEPSIAEVLTTEGTFSVALALLPGVGLDTLLADCDSDDLYTVFLPADADLLADAELFGLGAAQLAGDAELTTALLSYHLFPDAYDAAALTAMDGEAVTTVQGEDITIAVDGAAVTLVSGNPQVSSVVSADIQACNGVIHVVDHMMLPPSIGAALFPAEEEPLANTGATSDTLMILAIAVAAAGAMVVTTGRRLASRV